MENKLLKSSEYKGEMGKTTSKKKVLNHDHLISPSPTSAPPPPTTPPSNPPLKHIKSTLRLQA